MKEYHGRTQLRYFSKKQLDISGLAPPAAAMETRAPVTNVSPQPL